MKRTVSGTVNVRFSVLLAAGVLPVVDPTLRVVKSVLLPGKRPDHGHFCRFSHAAASGPRLNSTSRMLRLDTKPKRSANTCI